MENSKVIVDFSTTKYTDARLSIKANHIIDKMDGNPHFADVQPLLAVLRQATTTYIAALAKTQSGSKEDTALKIQAREALIVLLKQIAARVQTISEGDRNIILSSGYDVNKKWSKVGPLSKPTNFRLQQGSNKGSIYLVCDPIAGAGIYEVEYTEGIPTPNSIWMKQSSTKRKITIDGLTSGKQYTFRMAGGGSHPSRIWSEAMSSYVL
jgi:hypothetical protein